MFYRYLVRCTAVAALLASAMFDLACGSTASKSEVSINPSSAGRTNSTVAPGIASSQTIAFDNPNIAVSVLSEIAITVHVEPAQGQAVTFALVGESFDASLQSAQLATDASGSAQVTLTAPSKPTSFTLRAAIDRNIIAEASVEVTATATGTVEISTKYTGSRHIATYAIQVFPDEDCSTLSLLTPTAKRISVTSTSVPIRVDNIPLGAPLAVTVDGDHTTVRGCVGLRSITNASTVGVEVTLDDLPLNLNGQSLDVALTATDSLLALQDSLKSTIPTLLSAFVTGDHDLVALLAEMEAVATGSLQQEYAALRKSSNWDSLVMTEYAAVGGVDFLRRQLRDWFSAGLALLSRQPSAEVRLALAPADSSTPQLTPLRIAGFDAATQFGMQASSLAINIEPGDRLSWSSTLSLSRSVVMDSLALAGASVVLPTSETIPAQLATRLDCGSFASTLEANAVWSSTNSRVCGATCLATLCRDTLIEMYRRARAAAFGPAATSLVLTAAGNVAVNLNAQPTSTTGNWVGVWTTDGATVPISGTYVSELP